MSVNLFSVLDVLQNHYFVSATKCVCVSLRAVYLVLLNLSFPRMSVCVCVCVCVYVTERETVLRNSPL